jgi:ribosomal protein S18 acetylase RimI-like enzyme
VSCGYCRNDAVYKCYACGKLLCARHARLGAVCPIALRRLVPTYAIRRAVGKREKAAVRGFVRRFWGEMEQLTFDKKFSVAELPAYVARVSGRVVGFVATAEMDDAVLVVALGVLPRYQHTGVGTALIEKVERDARQRGNRRILVSTSNDDLPAFAFYQSLGFQIFEVRPNVVAEKHGAILPGVGGLPIRDELRLQKTMAGRSVVGGAGSGT